MREERGAWVYIMADRYRGTMYVGVTTNLPARIHQHRTGEGSDFCHRYGLTRLVWAEHTPSITDAIAHEKRLKRWRRAYKFDLIERANPDWRDCSTIWRSFPASSRARAGIRLLLIFCVRKAA